MPELLTRAEEEEIFSLIAEAIGRRRGIHFTYDGLEREVAPYVLGYSSEGNPLLRGYQTRGWSVSGKGPGWRVFQVKKMGELEMLELEFEADFSEYDPSVPWIYEVWAQV